MAYSLQWRSPALPYLQKQSPITVGAGSTVSNAASLRFTGKGASNYGKIQQENLMGLLENFAGPTEPPYATVGQTWYDTSSNSLKVCISTAPDPVSWRSVGGAQVGNIGDDAPSPASLGDMWFSRTGSSSGTLYAYTGVGRYPARPWTSVGYFPTANTNTLAFKANFSTFTVANPDEVYISGYSGGVPADVNGTILVNGSATTVPKGPLFASMPSANAYVVWATAVMTSVTTGSGPFFQVRQNDDGTWMYDNNAGWVTFTPTSNNTMFAIGTITVAETDDDSAPGVTVATPWTTAKQLHMLSQVPNTLANGAIGGWEQVFPAVERAAGRDEYETMYALVAQLLGDPQGFTGSGVLGRAIGYLTNFNTLDASTVQSYLARTPLDTNVLGSVLTNNYLKVEPNSADWDLLLAAAKYAVNRLELPPGYLNSISPYPFVIDGRQVPTVLTGFSNTNVQYPSLVRMANRKPGSVTLNRYFSETVNVLNAAIQNKYLLKGMLGTSGVNTAFGPTVAVTQLGPTFSYSGQFTSTVTHYFQYKFDYNQFEIERFFFAGQAIEVIVKHPASSTASDIDLKAITDTRGRFRITGDAVYVMDSSATPAVTLAPITNSGFLSLAGAGIVTLATFNVGTAMLSLRASVGIDNDNDFSAIAVFVVISTSGAVTGATTIQNNYIGDTETYGSSVPAYTAPLAYLSTDKTGPFA